MSTQLAADEKVRPEPDRSMAVSTPIVNAYEHSCPYLGRSAVCKASLSSLVPTVHARKTFCINEDYDACPIFLAKLLRRSKNVLP